MQISNCHIEWIKHVNEGGKKFILKIVKDFIDESNIPGENGIKYEYKLMLDIDNQDEKVTKRFYETAYTIWALKYYDRSDILNANIKCWGDGIDKNGSSHFRSFEFESSTALRFLEEGYSIKNIEGESKAEFCISNEFVIECKRCVNIKGLFKNTVKAIKQINKTNKPGILIFNIDDTDIVKDTSTKSLAESLDICLKVVEYGLGTENNNLVGVVVGIVSENEDSEINIAIDNNLNYNEGNNYHIFEIVSKALNGDGSLKFSPCTMDINKRYKGKYDKEKLDEFFNNVIVKELLS